MAYSEIADIKKKIGNEYYDRLTEKVHDDDADPDDKAEQAIKDADAVINSYIRDVTTTIPIDPVPDLIKQYSRDLAISELCKNQPQTVPEQWRDEKPNIIRSLRDIANGVANLDTGPTEETATVRISHGSNPVKIRRDRPL